MPEVFICYLAPGVNTLIAIIIAILKLAEHLDDKKSQQMKIQEQHSNGIFEVMIDGKKYTISDEEF